MRTQALFDRVAEHLLAQRRSSTRIEPGSGKIICAYRGHHGRRCAIGCLIADGHYDESIEGESVARRAVMRAVEASLGHVLTSQEVGLLRQLQAVHDVRPAGEWAMYLQAVAEANDLEWRFS